MDKKLDRHTNGQTGQANRLSGGMSGQMGRKLQTVRNNIPNRQRDKQDTDSQKRVVSDRWTDGDREDIAECRQTDRQVENGKDRKKEKTRQIGSKKNLKDERIKTN